jgi:hypothetical protein
LPHIKEMAEKPQEPRHFGLSFKTIMTDRRPGVPAARTRIVSPCKIAVDSS